MKVVLDTNVLASGIFWGGTPLKVLDLWKKESFEVVASDLVIDEYLRTIQYLSKKMDRADLYQDWSLILPSRVSLVSVKKSFQLCRDPKDDMFIDCAVADKARFIVSGDKDLLVLNKVMSVQIIEPKFFLGEFTQKA